MSYLRVAITWATVPDGGEFQPRSSKLVRHSLLRCFERGGGLEQFGGAEVVALEAGASRFLMASRQRCTVPRAHPCKRCITRLSRLSRAPRGQPVVQQERMLRGGLLKGRVRFTSEAKQQSWTLHGQGTIEGLFTQGLPSGMASPRGTDNMYKRLRGQLRRAA